MYDPFYTENTGTITTQWNKSSSCRHDFFQFFRFQKSVLNHRMMTGDEKCASALQFAQEVE